MSQNGYFSPFNRVTSSVALVLLLFGLAGNHTLVSATDSRLDRSVVEGPLAPRDYWLFESGPVRPLAMSHDGKRLYAANIPDSNLEVFAVTGLGLTHLGSVPVGMEPVAVAVSPDDRQVWVVNHLSDSVSVINVSGTIPFVEETLLVGDEPRDIVFAGPGGSKVFITTAHRGQNSPVDPRLTSPGVGRADVWVFDSNETGDEPGGTPLTIVTLFGDTPRALAASADGSKVYAAIFRSGNRTTTLPPAAIFGFPKPPPNDSADGVREPSTGIIVRLANGIWQDEIGRDYNNIVGLFLPDLDVFEIDAEAAFPVETRSIASVGTTLFNMAVNPVNGDVYVSNTEARNFVRFAGDSNRANSSVRGHLADHRVTLIRDGQVLARGLNKHLDFSKPAGTMKDRNTSLSMPMGMVFSSDGGTLYLAAYGSAKVAVIRTDELASDTHTADSTTHIEVGGGPAGLALDEKHNRLYVLTRFDNAVSVIDLDKRQETDRKALFNPEPTSVTRGRKFHYDARITSGFGNESCNTCHLFGDNDALAWDLGDPDGEVRSIPNAYAPLTANHPQLGFTFHPLKGPMTTQSMRGLPRHGPQHWRGDRTGADRMAGETLEEAAFKEFNEAFGALAGRAELLSDEDMQAFSDFAMQLTYPPNPNRRLDNSLTDTQRAGLNLYMNGVFRSNGNLEICVTCHTLDPAAGIYGTTGLMAFNDQPGEKDFKIPHFRDQYQKVGMFTSFTPRHEVRGFAMNHNGATSINALFSEFGVSPQQTNSLKKYLFAFPAETAPVMGQQLTVNRKSFNARSDRYRLLLQRAKTTLPYPECDLVIHGLVDGRPRGWSHDRANERFVPDHAGLPLLDEASMQAVIEATRAPLTLTCTPWGSGTRVGTDRDGDRVSDFEEVLQGSNPGDPGSRTFRARGGLWLNPLRPGAGMDLQHAGESMVLTWFTFDEDDNPTWYQAVAEASKNWQADLLRIEWNPDTGTTVEEVAGRATITFSDSRTAVFDWRIGERVGREEIKRFVFSRQPTALPFTGLWFDPGEPGYGLTVDTQGDIRVVVVYFYDNENQPRWVLIQQENTLAAIGKAISVTGPCPWCEFKPAVETDGGEIALNFTDPVHARTDINVFLHNLESSPWQREEVSLLRLTDQARIVPFF